jgi:subtilisin family serine protease
LTGVGQVVGSADTGVDRGNCYLSHGSDQFAMYRTALTGNDADEGGHGTHVVGSIVGRSDAAGAVHDGQARGAKIAFTDIGREDGALVVADDMGGGLYQHAYDVGARIHSDSWGYSTDWYVEEARETDAYAHANRDFLPMFALGNDGPSLGRSARPRTRRTS